jgi:hypothetical protein
MQQYLFLNFLPFSLPNIRITDLTRAHVIQKWTGYLFSLSVCLFLHALSQTSSSKVLSSGNQGLYTQITSTQSFYCCLETWAPPHNKKWFTSERKDWTLHWFCLILSHLPPMWGSPRHFQNYPSGPCSGC